MKKIIAILGLVLMFMQAVPVLHLFVSEDIAFTLVEEDKPAETKLKEKKDGKEYVHHCHYWVVDVQQQHLSCCSYLSALPAPFLESFTPPPDGLSIAFA